MTGGQDCPGEERAKVSKRPVPKGERAGQTSQWSVIQSAQALSKTTRETLLSRVWIPNNPENSSDITQFHTISLLSVEDKGSFKILASHPTEYLLRNSYIDTAVQKGSPRHSGMHRAHRSGHLIQLIQEARENKGDLAII